MNLTFDINRGLEIFVELLVAFFCSVFIVCFASAVLCVVFLQFFGAVIFLLFAPFVALLAGLPGLLFFGFPAALIVDLLGVKKRIYWVVLGIFIAILSYYLIVLMLEQHNILFLLPGLAIGAVTGSKLHHRLYDIKGSLNGS